MKTEAEIREYHAHLTVPESGISPEFQMMSVAETGVLLRVIDCFRAARVSWPEHVEKAIAAGDVDACAADAKARHANWEELHQKVRRLEAELAGLQEERALGGVRIVSDSIDATAKQLEQLANDARDIANRNAEIAGANRRLRVKAEKERDDLQARLNGADQRANAYLRERDEARADREALKEASAVLERSVTEARAEVAAVKLDRDAAFTQQEEMLKGALARSDDNFNALQETKAELEMTRVQMADFADQRDRACEKLLEAEKFTRSEFHERSRDLDAMEKVSEAAKKYAGERDAALAREAVLLEALTNNVNVLDAHRITPAFPASMALADPSKAAAERDERLKTEGRALGRADIPPAEKVEAIVRDEMRAWFIVEILGGALIQGARADATTVRSALAELIARVRREALEEAAKTCMEARLPAHYKWGSDAMESFTFGAERAAAAIRTLAAEPQQPPETYTLTVRGGEPSQFVGVKTALVELPPGFSEGLTEVFAGAVERAKPVCSNCGDTHEMWHSGLERNVPCTRCPTPCQECRAGGNGAYCEKTPCACACHGKVTS